jgi:ribosomal protein S18 acetylase RimI-like enzyme
VGFVYGMPNDRAHWWSTVVEPYLRANGNDVWLDDSFVITELHVHPAHQNRGAGRALITTITDTAAQPRSILSAIDIDSPARALYHSLGYQDLARRVLFPSAPRPYAVMGAPLPLRRP